MGRGRPDAERSGAPLWFAAALLPMIASQILRLDQREAWAWLAFDYAGRLGGLAVLAALARPIAFRRERLRMSWPEVALWVVGSALADRVLATAVSAPVNALIPASVLGAYPNPTGALFAFNSIVGLALVAFSEEIVFRRCAQAALGPYVGEGWRMVASTALLFGAYHWWTGIGNILEAAAMGVVFMRFYQRSGALWPVVLGHYLADVASFA